MKGLKKTCGLSMISYHSASLSSQHQQQIEMHWSSMALELDAPLLRQRQQNNENTKVGFIFILVAHHQEKPHDSEEWKCMCAFHQSRSRPDRRLDSCPPDKTMFFCTNIIGNNVKANGDDKIWRESVKQQQKWFLPGIQSSERANSSQGMGLPTPEKKTIFFMFFWDISFDYLEPVRTWSKVSWSGDQSIAEMTMMMMMMMMMMVVTSPLLRWFHWC